MTTRWRNAWIRHHRENGGWDGRATINAMMPRAKELRGLGLTARQTGVVTARENQLHSHARDLKELAGEVGERPIEVTPAIPTPRYLVDGDETSEFDEV